MFYFLSVANLNISKGAIILLDACQNLMEKNVSFCVHFVGSETAEISKKDFLKEIINRRLDEYVIYHGIKYGTEKDVIFNEANAFVHPTLNDCFPLVLLEAMQHSLPIISTPIGAIPDMVTDGDNGLLIPENDPVALACAMRKLIENPQLAHDMGERGYARFVQYYTTSAFERNLLEILKNI